MFEDPKSTWRTRVVCSSPKVYSEWCWIMGEQKAKLILKQYGRNPRHVPTKLSHPAHSQGFSFDRTFTCLAWSWPNKNFLMLSDAIRIQGFRPCQTLWRKLTWESTFLHNKSWSTSDHMNLLADCWHIRKIIIYELYWPVFRLSLPSCAI